MKYSLKIKFLGASGTVTGSSFFLSDQTGRGILIDFGMFQGTPKKESLNKETFKLDISKIDAVLITHAHLDHSGRLPILYKKGFRGKIFLTPATAELVELILFDSAKIADQDEDKEALYTKEDVAGTIELFELINFHKEFVAGSFAATAYDSGHLLGACSFLITDGKKKIVFSGDLGNSPQTLVKPVEFIDNADIVVMETTYGDRKHPKENSIKILKEEINIVERKGGTLLIPSFSLNKTQDLLYRIKELKRKGQVKKKTTVLIDSPMAIEATDLHLKHRYLFNKTLLEESKKGDPFAFPGIIVRKKKGKKDILKRIKGPLVIIAGSGMMSGGRIVGHAKKYLPRKNTRLLIVGYQGEGTLGREIQEGAEEVMIEDEKVSIKAKVVKIEGMSSHAGKTSLLTWLKHINGVKQLILAHGDNPSRQGFANFVRKNTNIKNIVIPNMGDEVILESFGR